MATISAGEFALGIGVAGLVYLGIVFLVAGLMTKLFGDAPLLVVLVAVFWPGLLLPVLVAAAGYRMADGQRLDGS